MNRITRIGMLVVLGSVIMTTAAYAHPVAPAQRDRAALYQSLGTTRFITEGQGPRILYVFFDANCPYCHLLFSRLKRFGGPYHVTVREILVGYVTPTSVGKAAALLEAHNPSAALMYAETHYSWTKGSAIAPIKPNAATARALAKNMRLDKQIAGFTIVPVMVYKEANGTIRIRNIGMPPVWKLKKILASIQKG
ncbi:MAG: thioredoxin fold domain-containing protein [Acidiferrobacteraceae bacterium]